MDATSAVTTAPRVYLTADNPSGPLPGSAGLAASALAPMLFSGMTCALCASSLTTPVLFAMIAASLFVSASGGIASVLFKTSHRAVPIALSFAAAACIATLAVPGMRAGFYAFCNSIIWSVDEVHHAFFELIAPGDTVAGSMGFGVCLGVVTASFWWGLTHQLKSGLTLIVSIFMCGAGLHLHMGATVPALALGVAGWLMHCRLTQLPASKTCFPALIFNICIALLGCLAALLVCWAIAVPHGVVMDACSQVRQAFDTVRFGEKAMPQGDMVAASGMNGHTDTELTVTMDKAPSSDVLLRGFVGASFDGDAWQPVTHRDIEGAWTGMTSWLDGRGFSSVRQRSLYDDLKHREKRGDTDTYSVTVDASHADRRFSYVPTAARTSRGVGISADADGSLVNDAWGTSSYSYTVDNISPTALFDDASWLSASTDDYTATEKVYSAFADDTYTAVDKADARAIERLIFGDATWDAHAEVSDYAVISRVRTMLDTLASYTDTPAVPDADRSFISWFLDTAREGNSAYFATAATLAFRTQGIPARYVEGYRVSASDAAGAARRGKSMVLNDDDVHAWCEVYLDGLGWTPVEVTPGFYSQTVQADSVIDVGEAWSGGSKDNDLDAGAVMGDVSDRIDREEDRQVASPFALAAEAAATVLLLAALTVACALLQRTLRRHHARKLMNSDDQAVCIPALYRYLSSVMRAGGQDFDPTRPLDHLEAFAFRFPDVDVLEYRRVVELHQAFAFGGRRLKPNELRAMRRLTLRMHEALPEPDGILSAVRRYVVDIL